MVIIGPKSFLKRPCQSDLIFNSKRTNPITSFSEQPEATLRWPWKGSIAKGYHRNKKTFWNQKKKLKNAKKTIYITNK
jgi:hypothetical protein